MLRGFLRLNFRYRVALVLLFVGVSWILSGLVIGRSTRQKPVVTDDRVVRPLLVTEKIHAEDRIISRVLMGRIHALRFADIISEVSGKVLEVVAQEGSEIREGGVILKIEEYEKALRLRQAEAMLKQRELEYEASKSLENHGYRSEIQRSASLVALESAKVDLKRAEVDLRNTQVKAPFSGFIDRVTMKVGSFVNLGQVVAQVVDFSGCKVVAYLSGEDAAALRSCVNCGNAEVVLDRGKVFSGKVSFVSRVADTRTRTYMVEITVDDKRYHDNRFIGEGMFAEVRLPLRKVMAHKIPVSALTLSGEGSLGIKVIDGEAGVAKFIEVDVVDTDSGGYVWVVNAPDNIELVTRGHESLYSGASIN